jgi:2'-5' RNA ligase
VPAHVTLVVPWIPPEQIKQEHLEELEELLTIQRPFEFTLEKVCWFGERVLWLGPTPAAPFKRLTGLLADHFDTPPWQGEFTEVVPHLTVGLVTRASGGTLSEAAEDLVPKLPVSCRATEVDVMCGDGSSWSVVHRVSL